MTFEQYKSVPKKIYSVFFNFNEFPMKKILILNNFFISFQFRDIKYLTNFP